MLIVSLKVRQIAKSCICFIPKNCEIEIINTVLQITIKLTVTNKNLFFAKLHQFLLMIYLLEIWNVIAVITLFIHEDL